MAHIYIAVFQFRDHHWKTHPKYWSCSMPKPRAKRGTLSLFFRKHPSLQSSPVEMMFKKLWIIERSLFLLVQVFILFAGPNLATKETLRNSWSHRTRKEIRLTAPELGKHGELHPISQDTIGLSWFLASFLDTIGSYHKLSEFTEDLNEDGRAEWSWENDKKPMEPLQVKPHGNFTIIPWGFHGSNSFPPPLLPGLKGCQMAMIRMMYHLLSTKVLKCHSSSPSSQRKYQEIRVFYPTKWWNSMGFQPQKTWIPHPHSSR